MADGERDGAAVREAFSLLAHEVRLDIVLALLDNWAAVYTEPQSYSELMDAVGMEDSGKFNYHLDKLRGVYVEGTDEGYVPTASATALYRAVLAHRPTETVTRTGEIDDDCPHCGGDLLERYERGFFTLDCADCDNWELVTYSFPANGIDDRTGTQRYRAVGNRSDYHVGLARTGQCPFCAGTVDVDLDPGAVQNADPPIVGMACETCTWHVSVDALKPLRFVPRVAAALVTLDVDSPVLEADPFVSLSGTVRSRSPFRVALTIQATGGTATIVVDGSLDVCAVSVETAE